MPELGHPHTLVFVQFDLANLFSIQWPVCLYVFIMLNMYNKNIYKNISLQAASQQANPLLHSMATLYSPKGVAMPSLENKRESVLIKSLSCPIT